MAFGWAGRILYIDLTDRSVRYCDTGDYSRQYLGGRALASRLAWEEIPAGIDAYDPANRIIVAAGPLTGTLSPTGGRFLMGSLSPRLYPKTWYTHSTLGGWFGAELKYAGFDAIVLSGRADTPVVVEISDGRIKIVDAGDLWGLDARQAQLALKRRLGEGAQVLTIGPAGENRVRFASVQHSEDNAAGHSGFGGVWGSKNLKAIVVRGSGMVRVAHPDALLEEVGAIGKMARVPLQSALRERDPKLRRPVCSQACPFDCMVSSYEQLADGRLVPGQCITVVWRSEHLMAKTHYTGGDIKMPPGVNFEKCKEVALHELCNNLGLDLWFRLVMQPWFIRCRELGITHIRGFEVEPENGEWFTEFMHAVAYRRDLGAIFADDLLRAVDELESELPAELVRLGRELEFGFGFPAHREGRFWDEEPLPFWVISAMMYASESRDPTIGTHQSSLMLAEYLLADRELGLRKLRVLSKKVWGYADALEPTFENKAPVAVWSQNRHMLNDSWPVCDFAFPQLVRPLSGPAEWRATEDVSGDLDIERRLFAAVTGWEITDAEATEIAERAFTLERIMLARAGRGRAVEEALAPHFELPCRADGTSIDAAGFSRLLDEYYRARHWDLEHGWPGAEELKRLGLEECIGELPNRIG